MCVALVGRHTTRIKSFVLIGGGVFMLGAGLLFLFVSILGMNETVAYYVQAVISVIVNYVLNWRFTWGDRRAPVVRSASRFILIRVITVNLNTIFFAILVHGIHVHYQVANILIVACFACLNYVVGHKWTFSHTQEGTKQSASQ